MQEGGEAGELGGGWRGGLAAAEGVDWEGGEGDEGWEWWLWLVLVLVLVLDVEVLAAEVLLHAVGEAVGDVVRVEAGEVEVPEERHCGCGCVCVLCGCGLSGTGYSVPLGFESSPWLESGFGRGRSVLGLVWSGYTVGLACLVWLGLAILLGC